MGVEQPVDEVEIAGTARAGTDRKIAGYLRFAGGRERCNLLVTYMHPFDCSEVL
jgi:hypothetical protein